MTADRELESQAIRAASEATKQKKEIPTEIRLSRGIVLKIKAMPPMLLNSVANSIPEPEIPVVFIEEKQREEPNPNHPVYIQQLARRQQAISLAMINLILFACTEIKEVPDGVSKPEDDDWVVLAEMAGMDFAKEDKVQRYLTWLRAYALQTAEDLNRVQTIPLQLAGITEAEVDEAMSTFRSSEERDSDSELTSELGSVNGDHVPEPDTRSSARNRRA